MTEPNFMVIGAAKSGTSSLCALLGQHPDVFMCVPKEPRLFAFTEKEYQDKWDWYCDLFQTAPHHVLAVGEGSQVYTARPMVGDWPPPRRIADRLPHVKLIYIVRHPIARLVSGWRMFAHEEPHIFKDFNRDVLDPEHRRWFIERSKYWFQISAYREFFPDDQIRVLFFEEFIVSPLSVLDECSSFLGVDRFRGYAGTDCVRNAAPARLVPNSFLRMLRQAPVYLALRSHIPERLCRFLRRTGVTHRETLERPQWNPRTLDAVISEIEEDSGSFLSFAGKPADYWTFDVESWL